MSIPSLLAATLIAAPLAANNGERCVQIRSVDYSNSILEVHNFGNSDFDLSGWRFCSHDTDEVRQYTNSTGLDGVTIEAGTSIFVHYNNDAPGGDPDRVNQSTLGSFATPLDQDAYGIQLFFPNASGFVNFGDDTLIADHLQWNVPGGSVGSSTFRTGQSVNEGLWTGVNDFVITASNSLSLDLTDLSGDEAGGPSEYSVLNLPLSQTALIRGQTATLTATNAFAGEQVFFLYTLSGVGAGPAVPQLGGLQLDLLNPVEILGNAAADASGQADFSAFVPASAPLITVWTQAVIARGAGGAESVKSPFVEAVIQP